MKRQENSLLRELLAVQNSKTRAFSSVLGKQFYKRESVFWKQYKVFKNCAIYFRWTIDRTIIKFKISIYSISCNSSFNSGECSLNHRGEHSLKLEFQLWGGNWKEKDFKRKSKKTRFRPRKKSNIQEIRKKTRFRPRKEVKFKKKARKHANDQEIKLVLRPSFVRNSHLNDNC